MNAETEELMRSGWELKGGDRRILLVMLPTKSTTSLRWDLFVLSAVSALLLVAHFLVGNGYGFHRDELQFLDDARHLQWGFVPFPPMTSFFGRVAIALFGISVQVLRLPAVVVNAVSLGAGGVDGEGAGGWAGRADWRDAALLSDGANDEPVMQYTTFDRLAWSVLILSAALVLRTGDERYCMGAGVGLGLGELSKYAIAFALVSLLAGIVVLPSQRRALKSRWFWMGRWWRWRLRLRI